ncbi:DNA helicase [Bombiscardovia nodaiensis]|uniref:DNA helicase n=1 Tax=Bombiscardovia nodaiensis TaxID=2932181 RepID=A0ABM8B6C2_9BIFI|nr:DNA helicase [Bombiscardovia nodaiensis]
MFGDRSSLMSGTEARSIVEDAVRRELFGPKPGERPRGNPLDCSRGKIIFPSGTKIENIYHDQATGEEILTQGDPLHRYGVGVLHPAVFTKDRTIDDKQSIEETLDEETPIPGLPTDDEDLSDDEVPSRNPALDSTSSESPEDADDFDLSDANHFKPSAMAISFKGRFAKEGLFNVTVTGAYYDKLNVSVNVNDTTYLKQWWVRRPFKLDGSIDYGALTAKKRLIEVNLSPVGSEDVPRISPKLQAFIRPVPDESDEEVQLLTVSVSNTATTPGSENTLFQMSFFVDAMDGNTIEPYPERSLSDRDEEEQSLELLYRNHLTYGIGHGCAATWEDNGAAVARIKAEPLPSYEVPSLTPNIFVEGTDELVTVSMRDLALGNDQGTRQIEQVLKLYGEWIAAREEEAKKLEDKYRPAAQRHLDRCKDALQRMQAGWSMVTGENAHSNAAKAFKWMNEAMLYQQLRFKKCKLRKVTQEKDGVNRVSEKCPTFQPIETIDLPKGIGNWRPFQIAFILATLPELVDKSSPRRDLVDLIFFPTGGGKTEAYLGASALSLLARRLHDPDDAGTDTLMRYTLRLLTTQQFQRAASLICVLENIRSRNEEVLGSKRFGIGIWLGSNTTPNTRKSAETALGKIQKDRNAQNPFLLLKCPWCGAAMGPQSDSHRKNTSPPGYMLTQHTVRFVCVDKDCEYSSPHNYLPVYVIDEDIYEERPSLIIGTVDKFAMLAWRPRARAMFGLDSEGQRQFSPPGLIIQDELHLISGPLGSMVGLYEPIIDDLCTDKRGETPIPPKIIASTATARRYEEQILALFGRPKDQVAIFPPHGLEDGHSFFAEPEVLDDGSPAPGRRYLGVFSASLGSTQTVQVRVAAATLQAANSIPKEYRDGYWTNLNFFNSLRELGNTVTLLQSDVPDYVNGLRSREGLTQPRWPRRIMELTSRRPNSEIPQSIEELEKEFESGECTDICLASNIIEVGIDIDRLGLMTIVGQPKNTAQYIQVSGRVGRRPDRAPGLVITLYGAAKPRDRSHFERFQTYHQQLYSQVEPTSVTPFAEPALKRALHAAIITYIRQTTNSKIEPEPFPEKAFDSAVELLLERAQQVDPSSIKYLRREAEQRKQSWQRWHRTVWSANSTDKDGSPIQGLMRNAGNLPISDADVVSWEVPTSMRNVDAECKLDITFAYNHEDEAIKDPEEMK